MEMIPLEDFLFIYPPQSFPQPWSWEDEELWLWQNDKDRMVELFYDVCLNGIVQPIKIGDDNRLWDGHHRICIAMKLGLHEIPIEKGPFKRRALFSIGLRQKKVV